MTLWVTFFLFHNVYSVPRLQVGDMMRSMTLLAYKSMEGSLEEVQFSCFLARFLTTESNAKWNPFCETASCGEIVN